MKKRMTIGVDFGGSASKATLLDESGQVLATAETEYPSYCQHPGWLEQDPEDYYRAFVRNVRELLERSSAKGTDIAALSVDAATHMAVLVGEDDRPLRRMIHWSDTRASEEAAWLAKDQGPLLSRYSRNPVNSSWTLPQILWLREHAPEVLERTAHIYFAKDYIRHRITGDNCTDSIEAMGSMLADDETATWSPELCALAGVEPDILPDIKAPADLAGVVLPHVAEETGLAAGTPVIVGTTDTALEVYASGAIKPGLATVKLATAGRICPITKGPISSPFFFNYKHVVPGLWYPGTATRSCAASYKWYRDVFGTAELSEGGESAYELLNREAEAVPAGCEGLLFHPYLLGELTPCNDDRLRGSFVGISMHHSKGHFTRSVMEGVAYSLRECVDEIYAAGVCMDEMRIIGGGAKGALWRQIVADVLERPLVCTEHNDSSLGGAMLAGTAVGLFQSYQESVDKCVRVTQRVEPCEKNIPIYRSCFQTYRAVRRALEPIYHLE